MRLKAVYEIQNTINGRRYIGSAVDLRVRWAAHVSSLNADNHPNSHLQRAWNKHGSGAFEFAVIEACDDLIETEQKWIDALWTEGLYNQRRVAYSNIGVRRSIETKERMSAAAKKRWHQPSENMLLAAERHGESLKGKSHSDQTRERMSKAHRGKTLSAETRSKMSGYAMERPAEHQEKISAARRHTYVLTDSAGVEHTVENLPAFARERGLSQAHLANVALGKRRQHKGWMARKA